MKTRNHFEDTGEEEKASEIFKGQVVQVDLSRWDR